MELLSKSTFQRNTKRILKSSLSKKTVSDQRIMKPLSKSNFECEGRAGGDLNDRVFRMQKERGKSIKNEAFWEENWVDVATVCCLAGAGAEGKQ